MAARVLRPGFGQTRASGALGCSPTLLVLSICYRKPHLDLRADAVRNRSMKSKMSSPRMSPSHHSPRLEDRYLRRREFARFRH